MWAEPWARANFGAKPPKLVAATNDGPRTNGPVTMAGAAPAVKTAGPGPAANNGPEVAKTPEAGPAANNGAADEISGRAAATTAAAGAGAANTGAA